MTKLLQIDKLDSKQLRLWQDAELLFFPGIPIQVWQGLLADECPIPNADLP
jgi:hypothetical protein